MSYRRDNDSFNQEDSNEPLELSVHNEVDNEAREEASSNNSNEPLYLSVHNEEDNEQSREVSSNKSNEPLDLSVHNEEDNEPHDEASGRDDFLTSMRFMKLSDERSDPSSGKGARPKVHSSFNEPQPHCSSKGQTTPTKNNFPRRNLFSQNERRVRYRCREQLAPTEKYSPRTNLFSSNEKQTHFGYQGQTSPLKYNLPTIDLSSFNVPQTHPSFQGQTTPREESTPTKDTLSFNPPIQLGYQRQATPSKNRTPTKDHNSPYNRSQGKAPRKKRTPNKNVSSCTEPQPYYGIAQEPQPYYGIAQEPQPYCSIAQEPQPYCSSAQEPQPYCSSAQEPQPHCSITQEPQPHCSNQAPTTTEYKSKPIIDWKVLCAPSLGLYNIPAKPIRCKVCHRDFQSPVHLASHVCHIVTKKVLYCDWDFCAYSCRTEKELKIHTLKTHHVGGIKHILSFYLRNSLNIVRDNRPETHGDNERVYCCPLRCGNTFRIEKLLKEHVIEHVENRAEPDHLFGPILHCGCRYTTNALTNLVNHMVDHGRNNFTCHHCNRDFSEVEYFINHLIDIHKIPGPYFGTSS